MNEASTINPAETDEIDEAAFVARIEAFHEGRCRRLDGVDSAGYSNDESAGIDLDGLAAARQYQAALADAGLAGLNYPSKYGGAGLTQRHQEIFTRTAAAWRRPDGPLSISHGMCLPLSLIHI